ncbi:MAG TPA: MarR family transcriptional regulator [Candidatus Baltobacteraceae bacterium]|nr:MarR family transcriptional regulator [Candidatus Baltobacteraceae bacterium]
MADREAVLAELEDERLSAHLLAKLKFAQASSRAALDDALAHCGLTTPQFLALAMIETNDQCSSADLARRSFITPQAMTGIVARLEAMKLIRRVPAGGGRSLPMRLTDEGRAVLARAQRHAVAIERYIVDVLGPQRYEDLAASLERVTEALNRGSTVTRTAPWDAYVPNERA